MIPDPQVYVAAYPHIFQSQIDWIVANNVNWNVKFVLNEGDNVHFGVNKLQQWETVSSIFGKLDDNEIPYIMAVGNHDMGDVNMPTAHTRDTSNYNAYFPYTRYENEPWYGNHYGNNNNNYYAQFTVDNIQFLVITLEFAANDDVLSWANQVVSDHSNHFVIVVTHAYLGFNGYLLRDDPLGIQRYGIRDDGNDGLQTWEKFVSQHKNIHMVVCGHIHSQQLNNCARHQTNIGVHGNEVHELFANFQGFPMGGSGYMPLMQFDTELGIVYIDTYSPWLNEWLNMSEHEYEFYVPLSQYKNHSTNPVGPVQQPLSQFTNQRKLTHE